MEFWDIYDMDRIKTNKFMLRGDEFKEGEYHLVVHVCIFNSEGKMLIQQRQPFKEGWPNKWDITVGGSAIRGDSSQRAAERETQEELGIKLDLGHVRPHLSVNFSNGFDDYYLIEKDVNISDLQLQKEEVQNVKWATKEEIVSMIERDEFIPYYESLVHLLFDLRKKYGSHRARGE